MRPLFVCLYGETCAGKSTLGKNLSLLLQCRYISFGDLKRDEIKRRTKLGAEIESLTKRECPIPSEMGYEVIESSVGSHGLHIVSGYPISTDELMAMSHHGHIAGFVILAIDEPTLIARHGLRRECPICHFPGSIGDFCPEHSVLMVQREDVGIEELVKRRRLYYQRIEPFLQSEDVRRIPNIRLTNSSLTKGELVAKTREWLLSLLSERRSL